MFLIFAALPYIARRQQQQRYAKGIRRQRIGQQDCGRMSPWLLGYSSPKEQPLLAAEAVKQQQPSLRLSRWITCSYRYCCCGWMDRGIDTDPQTERYSGRPSRKWTQKRALSGALFYPRSSLVLYALFLAGTDFLSICAHCKICHNSQLKCLQLTGINVINAVCMYQRCASAADPGGCAELEGPQQ